MRLSKQVSYDSVDDAALIKWAARQEGGFSRTVRRALRLLQAEELPYPPAASLEYHRPAPVPVDIPITPSTIPDPKKMTL